MPDKKTFVKSDIVKELQGHFQAIPNNDVERIVDSIFKYLVHKAVIAIQVEAPAFPAAGWKASALIAELIAAVVHREPIVGSPLQAGSQ